MSQSTDPVPPTQPLPDTVADLRATERWFVKHGLPYFVPEERRAARTALHSRRTLAMLVTTALAALVVGVVLAYVLGSAALAPATLVQVVLLAVVAYAVTALRGRPILAWAVSRTLRSLRLLVPLVTRALPLLLLFVTFLFINAEVWELSSRLDGGVLWLVVLLFGLFGIGFLLVRLPEELDRADDSLDEVSLTEACRGTPLEERARRLDGEVRERAVAERRVQGYEKGNLVLVLLIAQSVQVLLLSLSVFVFFMVFGAIVMDEEVQKHWTGLDQLNAAPVFSHLSLELFQVSVFLAAFSGFYFAVYAVTDESYRDQFFTSVKRELDRAVAVRAVYLALRGQPAA